MLLYLFQSLKQQQEYEKSVERIRAEHEVDEKKLALKEKHTNVR